MKKPWILDMVVLDTSESLRGEASGRLSLKFRWCGIPREIEDWGEWVREIGVLKGELQIPSTGESPLGDTRPNELPLVMLVAARDMFEAYDPLRPTEDTEEMDMLPWGITVNRGVGDCREAPSRRRSNSPEFGRLCMTKSSPGGEEARLFSPILWYSERPESSM